LTKIALATAWIWTKSGLQAPRAYLTGFGHVNRLTAPLKALKAG